MCMNVFNNSVYCISGTNSPTQITVYATTAPNVNEQRTNNVSRETFNKV
jgi:hypothetical protein